MSSSLSYVLIYSPLAVLFSDWKTENNQKVNLIDILKTLHSINRCLDMDNMLMFFKSKHLIHWTIHSTQFLLEYKRYI